MKKIITALIVALSVFGGTAATASAALQPPVLPPGFSHAVWTSPSAGHALANWDGVPIIPVSLRLPDADHLVVTFHWASGKHETQYYARHGGTWVFTRATGHIPAPD